MIVEVDINVICPACGLVMVRYIGPNYVRYISCGHSGCKNNGIRYELPKIKLHEIGAGSKDQPCAKCGDAYGWHPSENCDKYIPSKE